MEELRVRLVKLRKQKNVSQSDVAKALYVSRSLVAKWENGFALPKEEDLEKLNNYYKTFNNPLVLDKDNEKNIETPIYIHYSLGMIFKKFWKQFLFSLLILGSGITLLCFTLNLIDWEICAKAGDSVFIKNNFYCKLSSNELEISYIGDEDYVRFPSHIYFKPEKWTIAHNFRVNRVDLSGLDGKSVYIPYTVNKIKFEDVRLKAIEIESGNSVYDSRDNCNSIIDTEYNNVLYMASTGFIPDSVDALARRSWNGDYPFYYGSTLIIPKTIKYIGYSNLMQCNTIQILLFEASKDDVEKIYWDKPFSLDDVYYDFPGSIYFYNEEAPVEKGPYWHYDENHNPVLW